MKKAIILFATLTLLALACGEEEGVTGREPDRLEPTSPAYVLKNVEMSFNHVDIGLLKAMLSKDFIFHFDPRDVGSSPPGSMYIIPESWSYTEFWLAVNNMFDEAYSINLSIPTGRVGMPGPNETTYKAENIPISLLVMIDELNGFIADTGYCNFAFEKYTSEAGKKYWRLSGWWDRTSPYFDENLDAMPQSLGRLLAMFY
jgi:hypothetical protein